ncbi:MAG TPA: hypothetical protein PKH16_16155, partial [Aequorivita sp.]|nr:hypothetical protein [Aequorivita sp.]
SDPLIDDHAVVQKDGATSHYNVQRIFLPLHYKMGVRNPCLPLISCSYSVWDRWDYFPDFALDNVLSNVYCAGETRGQFITVPFPKFLTNLDKEIRYTKNPTRWNLLMKSSRFTEAQVALSFRQAMRV